MQSVRSAKIAVILPCLNEEATIAKVVADFRAALPDAGIYVIDNGSTDRTNPVATAAGAIVVQEATRGKGNAVRRAFAAIDADVYVIADGDGTYDAREAGRLVEMLVAERLDMIVATRRKTTDQAYRARHEFGNRMFNDLLRRLFGSPLTDVFSGFRAFSRRYVRSFPSTSKGFEIETEMTMHALLMRMPIKEVACDYGARPEGSASKLNTWRDGFKIAWAIGNFMREYRPMTYFSVLAGLAITAALALFLPIFSEYLQTGLVPRFPTLIVSMALGVGSIVLAGLGILLDAIASSRLETRRLLYLNADRRSDA